MCIPLFTDASWQSDSPASFQAHEPWILHLICLLYLPSICISLLYQVSCPNIIHSISSTPSSPLSALRQNHRIGHLFFLFFIFFWYSNSLFSFFLFSLFYLPVCSFECSPVHFYYCNHSLIRTHDHHVTRGLSIRDNHLSSSPSQQLNSTLLYSSYSYSY